MAKSIPRPHERPGTGAEDIPPGATRKALNRPENPPGGAPGSGAGPRHMSGDPGDGNELNDSRPRHHEDLVPDIGGNEADEQAARDGSSARGGPGLAPGGVHRGDSTIGAKPMPGSKAPRQRRPKRK
jgi:hypothetical protein